MWSGIESPGRTYSPYTLNIEKLVPWRTLSGRQEVYIDHGVFRSYGESLPIYKPPIDHLALGDLPKDLAPGSKIFRFSTPHPKWGIHSTFQDNLRMLTLFRGGPHVYMNPQDAKEIAVNDNHWVEIYSNHGIAVCRAITSPRVPRGWIIMYHGSERNVNVPVSKLAIEKGKSDILGGNNNAPTRILPKVLWVVGGYAQLSYFLNNHGTSPSERDMIVAVRKLPLIKGEKPLYPAPDRKILFKVGT
jgi:nitrate reductase alpha subunit